MRLFLLFLVLFSLAYPHASPTYYYPEASSILDRPPDNITIIFSEHPDQGSSGISVTSPDGSVLSGDAAITGRSMRASFDSARNGSYLVSWHVLSADDGHFTKGSYVFSIGSESAVSASGSGIHHSSLLVEAVTIFLELSGQVLLVCAFLLFHVTGEKPKKAVLAGLFLVVIGASSNILVKSFELKDLSGGSLEDNLADFLGTGPGAHALFRLVLASVFLAAVLISGFPGYLLMIPILAMTASRSIVSHAAASSFYPEFSVLVNFVHLVSKEAWIGIALILLALSSDYTGLRKKFSKILGLAVLLTGLSGCYVIWLHLKDFSNILGTDWGSTFVYFNIVFGLFFIARLANELLLGRKGPLSERMKEGFPGTVAIEAISGLGVLFLTSLMIITTPPVWHPEERFSAETTINGINVSIADDPYDSGLLASFRDEGGQISISNVVAILGIDGKEIPIAAQKRSEGSFLIPKRAFYKEGDWTLELVGRRPGEYDTNAAFNINMPGAFTPQPKTDWTFTIFMAASAIGFVLLMAAYLRFGKDPAKLSPNWSRAALLVALAVFLLALLWLIAQDLMKSDFQKLCERNGGLWATNSPMRNGMVNSPLSVRGCTSETGSYHFARENEFAYFIRPVFPEVSLSPLSVGNSSVLNITVLDDDAPGELSISHGTLMHVIVIGSDLKTFYHLHPEQSGFDLKKMKDSGVYSVNATFPGSGSYLVSADLYLRNRQLSEQFMVESTGGTPLPEADLEPASKYSEGDYEVELIAGDLEAGKPSNLKFIVSKAGRPVTDLAPYLGAASHLSIVSSDLRQFIHTHGHLGGQATAHHSSVPPAAFGPEVEAEMTFRRPGTYVIFSEFAHEGKIIRSRFVVAVGP